MKRSTAQSGIRRIFPLFFWIRCNKCDCEFRRERGWMNITSIKGRHSVLYYCKDCSPTKADAERLTADLCNRPTKPLSPPVPPSPNGEVDQSLN